MMQIRTRNNLLSWLEKNAPSKAIARALQEGKVEVLGGFQQVPPSIHPGWIVKVVSKFNKTWYIVIQKWSPSTSRPGKYIIRMRDSVPWTKWIGGQSDNPLYRGDYPKKYKLLRGKELKHEQTT